jgi:hypothetical protein
MPSLKDNFDELLVRMKHGRDVASTSYKPIYYLVFPPRQILEVKRELPAWMARLRNENWDVHRFSLAHAVREILQSAPAALRRLWLEADRKAPLNWEKTNQALANHLVKGELLTRLETQLRQLRERPNALLLVTDLEALHPYMRIGTLESQLYDKFDVPTVFFYPGERTGKTRLKFLDFYPEDGNYRSVHVGG